MLDLAQVLLRETRHVAIATVNTDGSPHCSPVFMVFDERLRGIWSSDPRSLHSHNIDRTGQAFLVLFNPEHGGGLYIKARAKPVGEPDLEQAYATYKSSGHPVADLSSYSSGAPQQLYHATPEQIWVNQSQKDPRGVIIHDHRIEIPLDQLL
ncbi:MAG TPA: pyridoxamine 5'-phosphate oxidase family protein [Candidatus Saccharimonadia bacterium]|jgi:hypothetical protein